MTFFGRQGGPMRLVLSLVAVMLLAVLSFVIFNLNTRLDNQHQANVESIHRSGQIVTVNDQLTAIKTVLIEVQTKVEALRMRRSRSESKAPSCSTWSRGWSPTSRVRCLPRKRSIRCCPFPDDGLNA